MTTVSMPQLTEQMEEATVAKWLVEAGERVEIGDELVEIETDKATMAYACEAAGFLEPLVEEGAAVRVGAPIARLLEAPAATIEAPESPPEVPATEAPQTAAFTEAARPSTAVQPPRRDRGGREGPIATPLARRTAERLDVALDQVEGTGPRGRILQGDVLQAAERVPGTTVPGPAPSRPVGGAREDDLVEQRPLSTVQRTIARRMAEANAAVPHFQVACDVTVDAVLQTRADLQEQLGDGVRGPSLNDFVVRACALALRDHELVNASFSGDHFHVHRAIHVGIAVASEAGLLVATVTDADQRSILEVAHESRRLASSVRAGTASSAELTGATFTVSNLGMFGMTSIVPVVNPPQAAILGVGAVREELYLHDGQAAARQTMSLTLSGDHRILNGADAARFLSDVKRLIQAPLQLMAR